MCLTLRFFLGRYNKKKTKMLAYLPVNILIRRKKTRPSLVSGFSLIEVLLVVSSIAILAGISIPIYQSFQTRNDLDIAVTTIAQSMRRAQVLAQASAGDISYGVRVQTGSITIFKGINYSGRDINFDELF
ncbi:MAG: hypothetical protein NTV48_02810, partial [Candidatus Vogelbacteria bacterium]|nr:hypothetical protein [Candidatus Vogelbacteria bacterium]